MKKTTVQTTRTVSQNIRAWVDEVEANVVNIHKGTANGNPFYFLKWQLGLAFTDFDITDWENPRMWMMAEVYDKSKNLSMGRGAHLEDFGYDTHEKRMQFIHDNYYGAYFYGMNRAGKSHFCEAVLSEFDRMGYGPTMFITLHEAMKNYKASGFKSTILKDMATCGVLVIDDISAETLSEWEISEFKAVFDSRLKRPTFISSNTDMSSLTSILGTTLTSRIMHLNQIKVLPSDGK